MYNSPYYHYQPVRRDYSYYENYPYPNSSQQLHQHPFNSSNGQALHQTPYEQFAKPKQPSFSPNHIPINPTPFQSQNSSNSNFDPSTMNTQTGPNMDAPHPKEQVDFDKMLTTVGQLANTYHQVSPIVKQVGTIIKGFR